MKLTPLKVTMLCEIHWNPNFELRGAQAYIQAMKEFRNFNLVQAVDITNTVPVKKCSSPVELTERGKAFLALILATPLPELATGWKDPRNGELIL